MLSTQPTAVVLAGGEGRRLRPLTARRPKPMLPVANQPLLEHVLEALRAAGIDDIVFVVGANRNRIGTYFGDGDAWDVSISYVVQNRQLGTGHALLMAADEVAGPCLVVNGDRIVEPHAMQAVADAARDHERPAMAITSVEDPTRYGVAKLDGTTVTDVTEQPDVAGPGVINAGVYAVPATIFETLADRLPEARGELSLPAVITALTTPVHAVRYDGLWLDVSQLWDLPAVTGQWLDTTTATAAGTVAPSAAVADATAIAPSATVDEGAVVKRGTALGDNVHVGANVTIEHSVVLPDATIDAGAVVRDSIVGADATIGANVTAAGGPATVTVDDTVYHDVPLGGAIGDHATVKAGAVLAPGTIVGDSATVGPGAFAAGTIAADTTIQRG